MCKSMRRIHFVFIQRLGRILIQLTPGNTKFKALWAFPTVARIPIFKDYMNSRVAAQVKATNQ